MRRWLVTMPIPIAHECPPEEIWWKLAGVSPIGSLQPRPRDYGFNRWLVPLDNGIKNKSVEEKTLGKIDPVIVGR